ncbi:hypothetical protein [Mycobacterium sp. 1245852.3]|uniref:ATP-binding protein n=1 Tax=Mycobacterium sp. 1245852.3 TaxID=1856860 RepID=UPI0012EA44AC|nr:hypothetical protein [Mycobacterium sp. 1245852.3]
MDYGKREAAQPAMLVGRQEVGELLPVVAASRLVTLVGAPGVGKTRVAREVIERVRQQASFDTGFVDLAIVGHPDLVPTAMACQLGLRVRPQQSAIDALIDSVGDREMVAVLDHAGHVLRGCQELITALRHARSALRVVVTSSEAIGAAEEVVWRVAPLPAADAADLFAARIRQVGGSPLTDENQHVIDQLCRRLAGLPGAMELAAARVGAMPLREVHDSIMECFRRLLGSAHQRVREEHIALLAVAWSHRLCSESAYLLLRRLAVFRGAFTVDAARTVAWDDAGNGFDRALAELVATALIGVEQRRGACRYRLPNAVREYAAEKLSASGEAHTIFGRHSDYYTRPGERFTDLLAGTPTDWQASDWANVTASIDWKSEPAEGMNG